MEIKEILLTPKETQQMLKVSLPLVYKMANRGQLPCIRIPSPAGGKRPKSIVRFKKSDVMNFIEKHYKT